MEALSIRDAAPGDIAAVRGVWALAYGNDDRHDSAAAVQRLLAHGPATRLLVAELDGAIAGTLIAAFDGWRGQMYRLAVRPELQRRGIASALVRKAEAWLLSIGCDRIRATVAPDHDWATGFWRAAGYVEDAAGYVRNQGS